jgi:cysteine desulfurase / selenocysteine lyase
MKLDSNEATNPENALLPRVLRTESPVALAIGGSTHVTQLNNAATTPPLEVAIAAVNDFLRTYGALHRGSGPLARMTCEAVERALAQIRAFVGASDAYALVFTQNTSVSINLLARLLRLTDSDVIVTSEIEHTSNNLPWRFNTSARVVETRASDTGALDYEDLTRAMKTHGTTVKVIAVSGASNLTGYVPDLERLRAAADASGALLFVDAAQLAPHRPIDVTTSRIDALAFSAHKLYAPFGLGVLVLRKELLDASPVDPGGGSVDMISDGGVLWSPPAERHQTGTWNAVGVVALGAACHALSSSGWEPILKKEHALTRYAAERLKAVPRLRLHVSPDLYAGGQRIGTFPFSIGDMPSFLVAAVLEHEYGVEVRAGTICNHRLVRRWFGVSDTEQASIEACISRGDRLASYGIVRASLGIQTTTADIDCLASALGQIATEGPRLRYRALPQLEAYEPEGH